MTAAEPERAEAWFYLGAAYGVRAQLRVYRVERLAAARDGKRIKESLERALALDPAMHDAEFGIGMYRYYADVAPAIFGSCASCCCCPAAIASTACAQLERAATRGMLVRGEAQYQIHVLYLWYEQKSARGARDRPRRCRRAIRATRCSARSKRRSSTSTSTIAAASLTASEQLLALAAIAARCTAPTSPKRSRALNIARQSIALKQPIAPSTSSIDDRHAPRRRPARSRARALRRMR